MGGGVRRRARSRRRGRSPPVPAVLDHQGSPRHWPRSVGESPPGPDLGGRPHPRAQRSRRALAPVTSHGGGCMTIAGEVARRSARLLLVDDDEAACRLLSEVLEREAYRVVSALSADEAVAKLDQEGPFDAVVTDLRMPRQSGLDLLRVVRARDPQALVLVLTAFGDAAAAGEAIRAGAYDFISKPYDIGTLRETLDRALGRRRQAQRRPAASDLSASSEEPEGSALVGHSPSI